MIQEAKKDKHGSNWPRVFWLLKLAGHVLYLFVQDYVKIG